MKLNAGKVATALTACGIETAQEGDIDAYKTFELLVATALTACGIETLLNTVFYELFY